ncbi:MAG: ArsR/SmtB family transcription factor [Phycisphaerales bacterium JB054]
MTSVSHHMKRTTPGRSSPTTTPATPRQAARRRAPVDRLLDPELFKALSDPTRLKLLACVLKCSRPCSVTEVAACCSVDFSVVARHLSALARVGLLEATKEGRTVWYAPRGESLASRLRQLADAIDLCSAVSCCGDAEGGDRGCC